MDTSLEKYARNILLFGKEGQERLLGTTALIVGGGGLGSALAQHLALMGVGHIMIAEFDLLDTTNRNRFIGARATDPDGSRKIDLIERYIHEINPDIKVTPIPGRLESVEVFDAVRKADWVFGGFDHDGPRSILNELCAAYERPYIDMASDVPDPDGKAYGGHVLVSRNGDGCLHCMGLLDGDAIRKYLTNEADLRREAAVYGIDRPVLGMTGPSVSPINGVIAGLAATEFMVAVTGMRDPARLIHYRGHQSVVTKSRDEPAPHCLVCKGVWGTGDAGNVYRYLNIPHLKAA